MVNSPSTGKIHTKKPHFKRVNLPSFGYQKGPFIDVYQKVPQIGIFIIIIIISSDRLNLEDYSRDLVKNTLHAPQLWYLQLKP